MYGFGSKKKAAWALSLLTAVALVGSACSSDGSTSAEETIVLKVPDAEIWGEESSALQVMYDLYEQDHPDVRLEQVTVESKDLGAVLASGEAPDLMLMDPALAKDSFKQGYLEPMDKYYEQYGWSDDMFHWAKNAYVYKDQTIGVPWNYEGLVLVYNKTMFEANGWDVPRDYDDLMELVPKIQEQGIMPFAWGTADCPGCDDWWVTSIVNSVLGAEGTKQLFSGDVAWTDPAIVDALQRYSDFWNAGYVTDKKSFAISQEDSMQLFYTGKAAMRLDGTWSLASDAEVDFDIAFAAFPSWKSGGDPIIPLGVGGGLVVNAKSEHKDEVAALLDYFFHEDVVEAMAQNGIPEPIQADYSAMDMEPTVSAALNIISEAVKKGNTGYVGWSYGSPSVVNLLQTEVANVYLKKVSVEDWLAKLQELKEKDRADGALFDLTNY